MPWVVAPGVCSLSQQWIINSTCSPTCLFSLVYTWKALRALSLLLFIIKWHCLENKLKQKCSIRISWSALGKYKISRLFPPIFFLYEFLDQKINSFWSEWGSVKMIIPPRLFWLISADQLLRATWTWDIQLALVQINYNAFCLFYLFV